MNQSLLSKYILVVLLIGWAFWEINPPQPQDLIAHFQSRAEYWVDDKDEAISEEVSKEREKVISDIAEKAKELSEGNSDNAFSA